jgi:hypothetical protein
LRWLRVILLGSSQPSQIGQEFSERSNDRVVLARRECCTAATDCRADKCRTGRERNFAVGKSIAYKDRPSAATFLDARIQGARLGALVVTTEEVGQDGDAVEAYIFAYLAARYFDGLPITFPATTGAD